MASCSEWKERKNGTKYCRVSVSRGYGKSPYSTHFDWPLKDDGKPFARSTAEAKRDRFMFEFEKRCEAGQVLTREEKKAKDAEEQAEAAKIKTFQQYGEQVFMPAKTITCAEKTRKYYQNALDNHLYPKFGKMPISDISSAQLSAFFLDKQGSALSHSTVLGIYVTANQLFEMAYMNDTIPRNPLDKVKRPRQKKDDKPKTDPARFTQEEVKDIKKHLAAEPLKWQAFIQILLNTGMRRGEVCALTWDKIDFTNMTIKVDGSLGYTPEKGTYREKPKTEAGNRIIPMTTELSDVLRRYKAEQLSSVVKRTKRYEKDHKVIDFEILKKKEAVPEYLFTFKGWNDPILPDSVNRYFKRFSEKYEIADFHPHKLRHTAISIMLENGIPVVTVAAIAGHDDPNVTHNTYAHASTDGLRSAIQALEKATKII